MQDINYTVTESLTVQSAVIQQVEFVNLNNDASQPGMVLEFNRGGRYLYTEPHTINGFRNRVNEHIATDGDIRLGGFFNDYVRDSYSIPLPE